MIFAASGNCCALFPFGWFLGYGLEDEVPNHSVLNKARKRWRTEVFERLFARCLEQCVEACLLGRSWPKAGPASVFPSKLGAIAQLVKMCGWNEPEKHEHGASNELTELLKRLRGSG